jgi:FkbM family methyltransferase
MSPFRKILRELLICVQLDATANLRYDRLTRAVLKRVLREDSNTVDAGCHTGEILERVIRLSPRGWHAGFEPISDLFEGLQEKFGGRAHLYNCALYDREGEGEFFIVGNDPGYSSLRRRPLDFPALYRRTTVPLRTMDSFFDASRPVHFIKIDVEGAELQVLKGASALLARDSPVILFECGKGGYDQFNDSPKEIYTFLSSLRYGIYEMEDWLKKKDPLSIDVFLRQFESNDNYYFIAACRTLAV